MSINADDVCVDLINGAALGLVVGRSLFASPVIAADDQPDPEGLPPSVDHLAVFCEATEGEEQIRLKGISAGVRQSVKPLGCTIHVRSGQANQPDAYRQALELARKVFELCDFTFPDGVCIVRPIFGISGPIPAGLDEGNHFRWTIPVVVRVFEVAKAHYWGNGDEAGSGSAFVLALPSSSIAVRRGRTITATVAAGEALHLVMPEEAAEQSPVRFFTAREDGSPDTRPSGELEVATVGAVTVNGLAYTHLKTVRTGLGAVTVVVR